MRFRLAALLPFLGAVLISGDGFSVTFTPLPIFPDDDRESYASGISADGSTIVGYLAKGTDRYALQAVKWTVDGGIEALPSSHGVKFESARAVSGDGSVIVGQGFDGETRAVRWTAQTGTVLLEDDSLGQRPLAGYGVSDDGAAIVGLHRAAGPRHGFIWRNGRTEQLPLPTPDERGTAYSVTSDGSIVVGEMWHGSPMGGEAFRWSEVDGVVGLGWLPDRDGNSCATDVSSDGTIIVGYSLNSDSAVTEAFRWTEDAGLVGLGHLPGGFGQYSAASAVSADGSRIVGADGQSNLGDYKDRQAFLWDSQHGLRSISDLLNETGVDLSGWELNGAADISADGTRIVGWGVNPLGVDQAWLVDLSLVPEPTSGTLVALGLTAAAAHRRKRSDARR